jgi:hypothetical protein
MLTGSTLLQARLLRLMNSIAEAHRRGQKDVAETITTAAARTLMELTAGRRREKLEHRSIHELFTHVKPEN